MGEWDFGAKGPNDGMIPAQLAAQVSTRTGLMHSTSTSSNKSGSTHTQLEERARLATLLVLLVD
jgi:hypothetical protein